LGYHVAIYPPQSPTAQCNPPRTWRYNGDGGGNADGPSPSDRGGGLHNNAGAPTIRNVIFDTNAAATRSGAVENFLGAGTRLINVLFMGNTAFQNGSAIGNVLNNAVLTNVTFYGNSSVFGGVVHNNSLYIKEGGAIRYSST